MAKSHRRIKVESEEYSGWARLLLLDTEGLGSIRRSGRPKSVFAVVGYRGAGVDQRIRYMCSSARVLLSILAYLAHLIFFI